MPRKTARIAKEIGSCAVQAISARSGGVTEDHNERSAQSDHRQDERVESGRHEGQDLGGAHDGNLAAEDDPRAGQVGVLATPVAENWNPRPSSRVPLPTISNLLTTAPPWGCSVS
jgi:hypothetical protein